MKNLTHQILVFYHFQLQNHPDFNVTSYKRGSEDIKIKDVLKCLPLDLSQAKYHFRFKSEFVEGNEKIIGWIDINNLAAKAPMINDAIFIKILTFSNPSHNKLFNFQKLQKADLLTQSKPHLEQNLPKIEKQRVKQISQVIHVPEVKQKSMEKKVNDKVDQPKRKGNELNDLILISEPSQKSHGIHTSWEENHQTFLDSFHREQQERENERIAKEELEDQINQWGYTDGKKINNTSTLLATLHQIWDQWDQVSLADMLAPAQTDKLFKKAVVKVHPDKNRDKPFRQKYLAKRVFELLNQSRRM